MRVADFDYELPPELIAQTPVEPRDSSRLMVVKRQTGEIIHDHFYNLQRYLEPDDQLVFNNSKVFPARLFGNKRSGGKVEVLLIKLQDTSSKIQTNTKFKEPISKGDTWEVMIRNLGTATEIIFDEGLLAKVVETKADGTYMVEFNKSADEFWQIVEQIGHVPLPPYIKYESKSEILNSKNQTNSNDQLNSKSKTDGKKMNELKAVNEFTDDYIKNRYQTVYAKDRGSAAAPTAGLHFTNELLQRLSDQGIKMTEVTLHVGLGTFQPLQSEIVEDNHLHTEHYYINQKSLEEISETLKAKSRVVAVGTTSVRVLESWVKTRTAAGETDIFIYPGYTFQVVKKLITNFHLPQSSLLMLVCAFGGKELIMRAYWEAVKERYRFFSFGDAMIVV